MDTGQVLTPVFSGFEIKNLHFWKMMKLQNGSDVRGIALEGVEGEAVNLRPEAANLIAAAFVRFLAEKLGKDAGEQY